MGCLCQHLLHQRILYYMNFLIQFCFILLFLTLLKHGEILREQMFFPIRKTFKIYWYTLSNTTEQISLHMSDKQMENQNSNVENFSSNNFSTNLPTTSFKKKSNDYKTPLKTIQISLEVFWMVFWWNSKKDLFNEIASKDFWTTPNIWGSH